MRCVYNALLRHVTYLTNWKVVDNVVMIQTMNSKVLALGLAA